MLMLAVFLVLSEKAALSEWKFAVRLIEEIIKNLSGF